MAKKGGKVSNRITKKQLLELLIDFSKESGVEILYLEARADNERALNLYKKFGFLEIGRYKNFFKIGDKYYDASLMTLEIKNFKKNLNFF